jgi:polyphosphate kinase
MGSADWMPRNLDKRVEIVFPLEDEDCREEAMNILRIQLADNQKARILQSDGTYKKQQAEDAEPLCAQDYFCTYAAERAEAGQQPGRSRVFIPLEHAPEAAED